MARRTQTITIEEEGRDKGKIFILTEMPAAQADEWVTRAMNLLGESAPLNGELAGGAGSADLATLSLRGLAQLRALQDPSLYAWRDCVKWQPQDSKLMPQAIHWDSAACQIEEIRTITRLRMAVLELHTGFFSPENDMTSESRSPTIATGSSPTKISRPR